MDKTILVNGLIRYGGVDDLKKIVITIDPSI